MKNSDQKIFAVILLFFSSICVNHVFTMSAPVQSRVAAQKDAAQKDIDAVNNVAEQLRALRVTIPPLPPKKLFTSLFMPAQQKSLPKTTVAKSDETQGSLSSPRGMRHSVSWPQFRTLPDEDDVDVDLASTIDGVKPLSNRRSSAPGHRETKREAKSARAAGARSPILADIEYPKTAAEFVNFLARNPQYLSTFLENLTLEKLYRLLDFYNSDLIYFMMHSKTVLDAIDRAIRNNKLPLCHEALPLADTTSLMHLLDLVDCKDPGSHEDFNETVADKTVLMHLAHRGLTKLIKIIELERYIYKKDYNIINDHGLSALDFAEIAHRRTVATLHIDGLLPDQRVRYRYEAERLSECIDFLNENGALPGDVIITSNPILEEKEQRDLLELREAHMGIKKAR